jgi:phosphatidylinositol dimannoside acyltransferase
MSLVDLAPHAFRDVVADSVRARRRSWARPLVCVRIGKFVATRSAYRRTGIASTTDELDAMVAANASHTLRYYRRLVRLANARERMRMHAEVDGSGVALLERALSRGRGVILVSGHIGEFDLAASWLAQVRGVPVVVPVARTDLLRQPMFARVRSSAGLDLRRAEKTTLRQLEWELAQNRIVVVMLDRRCTGSACATSLFFAHDAAIARTPALMGWRTRAPIITGATHTVDGRSVLSLASLLDADAFDNSHGCRAGISALTNALVRDLEALIAAHPEQWHVPSDLMQLPWLRGARGGQAGAMSASDVS